MDETDNFVGFPALLKIYLKTGSDSAKIGPIKWAILAHRRSHDSSC